MDERGAGDQCGGLSCQAKDLWNVPEDFRLVPGGPGQARERWVFRPGGRLGVGGEAWFRLL